jgi:uncharacterized protein YndB with AHSA1/START domain
MANDLKAKAHMLIQAPVQKVWQALTDPSLIKQYLFGTDTVTDWKKGSAITYSGEYEGKAYQDKGNIIDIVPEKLLHITHYSSMSGKDDKPENYHHVIYRLEPRNGHTLISLTQDNISNEKELQHMEKNWKTILEEMKKLLEA